MDVLLNLTIPPILFLFLPPTVVGNYTLPAPPLSDIAAITPTGEPLPTWVIEDRLYVLQNDLPAVAIYVPQYNNATGLYTITINAERAIVQAPPGITIEQINPTPKSVAINKTGIYLYLESPFTITYTKIKLAPTPTPTPPTTPPTMPTQTPTTPTTPMSTPAVSTPSVVEIVTVLAAVVVAVAAAVFFLSRRGRGDCSHLNEVDLRILKTVESAGGAIERSALQNSLNLPKTTIHRHLHKLAKYGFVRLVQEGPRQRVELLRKC